MDIPPEHGGARVFFNDPEQAGLSTMVGDMAAMNLRLLHLMDEAAVPVANRGAVDALRVHARQILAASDICKQREQDTRELRPITRVPVPAWGNNENIGNIRMHSVPMFSGTSSDTLDVVRWISRVFTLCDANNLTYDAGINLLIQGSSGSAADYIEQMKDEDKP